MNKLLAASMAIALLSAPAAAAPDVYDGIFEPGKVGLITRLTITLDEARQHIAFFSRSNGTQVSCVVSQGDFDDYVEIRNIDSSTPYMLDPADPDCNEVPLTMTIGVLQ